MSQRKICSNTECGREFVIPDQKGPGRPPTRCRKCRTADTKNNRVKQGPRIIGFNDVPADVTAPGMPHSRKMQLSLERGAYVARMNDATSGMRVPPICGFTYEKRLPGHSSKKNPTKDDLTEAICFRLAGAGTDHHGKGLCDYHGALLARQVNGKMDKSAALRHAREIAYSNAVFLGQPINIAPHEAILQELHRTAGIVQWLEDQLRDLNDEGQPTSELLRDYSQKVGFQVSVWMQLYQAERKHLVDVAHTAIKAGIAERQVQLAEQQARIIAAVMLAFVHDPELGLNSRQQIDAPSIIRKHLSAIPRSIGSGLDAAAIIQANAERQEPVKQVNSQEAGHGPAHDTHAVIDVTASEPIPASSPPQASRSDSGSVRKSRTHPRG